MSAFREERAATGCKGLSFIAQYLRSCFRADLFRQICLFHPYISLRVSSLLIGRNSSENYFFIYPELMSK